MVVMVIFMWFLQKMSLTCNNGSDLLVTGHDFTVAGNIEILAQRFDFDLLAIDNSFLLVSKPGNQLGGVANYSNDKYFIIWNDKVTVNATTVNFVFVMFMEL